MLDQLLDVAKIALAEEDRECAVVELVERVRRPDVFLYRLGELFLQTPMLTAYPARVGRSFGIIFGPNIVITVRYGGLLPKYATTPAQNFSSYSVGRPTAATVPATNAFHSPS
ncbi:hypothetical protein [Anatilimnocola floriformis]|uniref:hypothetical protein n=1 Tax=Anatilimnocola floriformis TaxID=2948575 RepID=UPI0020C34B42|nr:hypothetical protein [Anatilimnocola floriformis]